MIIQQQQQQPIAVYHVSALGAVAQLILGIGYRVTVKRVAGVWYVTPARPFIVS